MTTQYELGIPQKFRLSIRPSKTLADKKKEGIRKRNSLAIDPEKTARWQIPFYLCNSDYFKLEREFILITTDLDQVSNTF